MPTVKKAPTKPQYRIPPVPKTLEAVNDLSIPDLPVSDQFDETWHHSMLVMKDGRIVREPFADFSKLMEICLEEFPAHDYTARNAWTIWMVYDHPLFVAEHGKVAYMAGYHAIVNPINGRRYWKACITDREYSAMEMANVHLGKVIDAFNALRAAQPTLSGHNNRLQELAHSLASKLVAGYHILRPTTKKVYAMPLHSDDPIYTAHGAIRFYDHEVDWIDGIASYNDAPAHDPLTFELTSHRFPHGLPEGCTLHYEDGFNNQPVICDNLNGVAYGLYVLD